MPNLDVAKASAIIDGSMISDAEKIDLKSKITAAGGPLQTGVWIYRIVVLALGIAIVAVFVVDGEQLKTVLPVSTAALAGLVGLLAPSPVGRG